jgi:hypothetical protein
MAPFSGLRSCCCREWQLLRRTKYQSHAKNAKLHRGFG